MLGHREVFRLYIIKPAIPSSEMAHYDNLILGLYGLAFVLDESAKICGLWMLVFVDG